MPPYFRYGVNLFPFLFGGTFIEGDGQSEGGRDADEISLPFRRDFH